MDIEFNSAEELYERLLPALRSKVADLKRDGYNYLTADDVWNYLKENKQRNSNNLALYEMVSDILNSDNVIIDEYFKDKLNTKKRRVYFEDQKELCNMKKKIITRILVVVAIVIAALALLFPTLKEIKLGLDLQGGFEVLYQIKSIDGKEKITNDVVNSTYNTLVKRIDVLGVLEPTINIEGDRIRVQLAGVDNADEARNILSQTASLTFRDTSDNLLMTSDVKKWGR